MREARNNHHGEAILFQCRRRSTSLRAGLDGGMAGRARVVIQVVAGNGPPVMGMAEEQRTEKVPEASVCLVNPASHPESASRIWLHAWVAPWGSSLVL